MSGWQNNWHAERNIENNFLAGDRSFSTVVWFGCGLMCCSTLLFAVKLGLIDVVVAFNSPRLESRDNSATPEGEFTLVGTCGVENVGGPLVLPTSDRSGNTR